VSSLVRVIFDPDTTAPAVPSGVTVTAQSSSVLRVTWGASTDTGGSGLSGYRVYRSTTLAGTYTQIAELSVASLSYDDTGLPSATTRYYKVASFDGNGNVSAQSVAANGTTQSAAAWQLPASHSIASSITMEIIHPRANASSQAYEAHRQWVNGLEFTYPIVVLGGRYSFRYVLDVAPAGATIGQYITDADYGVIRWASPTVGTHSWQVSVYDQDLVVRTVAWTQIVRDREDTTYSVFIRSTDGNDTTGTGAYSSPKRTLVGAYGSSSSDATNANKQVFIDGTVTLGGVAGLSYSGSQLQKLNWNNNKPKVLAKWPGASTATFAGNAAYFELGATNGGMCFHGMRFTQPTAPDATATDYTKRFAAGTSTSMMNMLVYNCTMVGTGVAPVPSSNPACFFQRSATSGGRFAISHCTFDAGDQIAWLLCYGGTQGVIQENTVVNGQSGPSGVTAIYFKGDPIIRDWSIRRNRSTGAGVMGPLVKVDWLADAATRDLIEVSHNTWYSAGATPYALGFLVGETDGNYGNNIRSFRNSWRVNYNSVQITTAGTISFINDAIQHDGTKTDGIEIANAARVSKTSLIQATSGVFDASMLLTSTYNAQRGTHGAEVQ
jgi:hypothetical protein